MSKFKAGDRVEIVYIYHPHLYGEWLGREVVVVGVWKRFSVNHGEVIDCYETDPHPPNLHYPDGKNGWAEDQLRLRRPPQDNEHWLRQETVPVKDFHRWLQGVRSGVRQERPITEGEEA